MKTAREILADIRKLHNDDVACDYSKADPYWEQLALIESAIAEASAEGRRKGLRLALEIDHKSIHDILNKEGG